MKTTVEQVRNAMLTMDQHVNRSINDGSGHPGTITLAETISADGSFCICDNINQWINDQYDNEGDSHVWSTDDIIDFVNEIYPIAE